MVAEVAPQGFTIRFFTNNRTYHTAYHSSFFVRNVIKEINDLQMNFYQQVSVVKVRKIGI